MSTDATVVVIGSGPSGATAAHELVRLGQPVTMLEAGTKPPAGLIVRAAGRTLLRWRSQSAMSQDRHVGVGDPDTEWHSSLSPGGLSNYWTAAVPRFAPGDFADGASLDERFAWPVTYDELVPYYETVEPWLDIFAADDALDVLPLGLARYRQPLPPAWEELAASVSPRALTRMPLARGGRWMVARRGSEFNSYHVIVDPLRSADRFELRRGAFATRLVVDDVVGRCTAVEYLDLATRQLVHLPARAVVVCAGTIDTTRLLLSSTSPTSPAGLGNEHGLVGRYLTDHPREWWRAEYDRPVPALESAAYLARAPYGELPPLGGASATIGLAASRDRFVAMRHGVVRRAGVQIFGTMVPSPDGTVRLSPTRRDRFGVPVVEIDLDYDDAARRSLETAKERFTGFFAQAGNPVRVIPEDWRPRPGSSVHYAGSVRMHERAEFGVLDPWNRVRSTPNVVVSDMACFTTNPEKNPTLTAMALSARAATRLAHDLR